MAVAISVGQALASGSITTWAGETRVLASERGVREVWLPDWRSGLPTDVSAEPRAHVEAGGSAEAERHLRSALDELAEYFVGRRHEFAVALDLGGTPFYQAAWEAVAAVPYGETRTYGEIARELGAPKATRAVGAANGSNPVAPFVPCHRIVGSTGALHGYGPGLPLKQHLLEMEDAVPRDSSDYPAWVERVRDRLGMRDILLASRATGTFCEPTCSRAARASLRPGRIFTSMPDALAAGFTPCRECIG